MVHCLQQSNYTSRVMARVFNSFKVNPIDISHLGSDAKLRRGRGMHTVSTPLPYPLPYVS